MQYKNVNSSFDQFKTKVNNNIKLKIFTIIKCGLDRIDYVQKAVGGKNHKVTGIASSTSMFVVSIDLSTARPKWRLDGPALSGHLLYSLVNHAYANRYHHHLVR